MLHLTVSVVKSGMLVFLPLYPSPRTPAPRWCVLSYFLSALARSRLQDPEGEHTANWQCLPSTLALGLFIYAYIYIPCGRYVFQAITVGCKKKVTFFIPSNRIERMLCFYLLSWQKIQLLFWESFSQPILRTKTASRFISGSELRKSSLAWGPHWSCLSPCVLWAQTHSDSTVRAKNWGWALSEISAHSQASMERKSPPQDTSWKLTSSPPSGSSSDLLPSWLDFLSLQVSVALSSLCPALSAFTHANW